MLEDKEKFLIAKLNFDLETLLELIMSNDSIKCLHVAPPRISNGFRNIEVIDHHDQNHFKDKSIKDYRSDLRLNWMLLETRVSHSCLN